MKKIMTLVQVRSRRSGMLLDYGVSDDSKDALFIICYEILLAILGVHPTQGQKWQRYRGRQMPEAVKTVFSDEPIDNGVAFDIWPIEDQHACWLAVEPAPDHMPYRRGSLYMDATKVWNAMGSPAKLWISAEIVNPAEHPRLEVDL
jgi:hypothetical protein